MKSINETLALLNKSYSPFHVVKNIEEKLLSSGYQMLKEQEMYQLKAGGRYFVKRNGTSIIAFSIPNDLSRPYFKISATHNDSPTFKLKPNPVVIYKNLASLNVEPYGISRHFFRRNVSVPYFRDALAVSLAEIAERRH